MESNTIKWFDLSRFGAELRVLPATPMRNKTLTCLDVVDRTVFNECFKKDKNLDQIHLLFRDALHQLDFDDASHHLRDEKNNRDVIRFYSTKINFSLNELRGLFSDLLASDVANTPKEKILISPEYNAESIAQWKTFANEVLAADAKQVWTPIVNPYAKDAYEDSKTLQEFQFSLSTPRLSRSVHTTRYGMSYEQFANAQYRTNALIEYYPDLESAMSDGRYAEHELKCVDLPYAAPLWVTTNDRVIAISDIRHCPEIMSFPPERIYNTEGRPLIVTTLRESNEVAATLTAAIEQWNEWASDKEAFRRSSTGKFVELLRSVGETMYSAHARNDALPSFDCIQDAVKRSEGTFQMIGIGEIRINDLRSTVRVMERYLPYLTEGNHSIALTDQLDNLHMITLDTMTAEKLRAVEVQRQADLEALAKLTSEKGAVIADATADNKQKHVDVGEKIGGARKDFARRAMTVEDLLSMNDLEKTTTVIKKNVWPPLDYEAMRERGVTPEAAIAIKYIKDKLNTAPVKDHSRFSGDNPEAEYIKAISLVRDAMADVKTMDEFKTAMENLYEIGITNEFGSKNTNSIYGYTSQQVQWGKAASELFHDSKGDRYVAFDIRREIRRKVPEDTENPGSDLQWKSLIKPKRVKSEAELEEEEEKTRIDRELHRPHLDHVMRSGAVVDLRKGRDVTAEDLMATFGFRAVEWGNWLPQNERQEVINMAYDAFTDLSEALEIPPGAVSLGWKDDVSLGVAFGARGSGGKRAALAHFEPSRFVINLTRMNGAGSLAHEIGHSFDHTLGNKKEFASGSGRTETIRELYRAMHNRAPTEDEVIAKVNSDFTRCTKNAIDWICYQSDDVRGNLERLRAMKDEVMDKIQGMMYSKIMQDFTTDLREKKRITFRDGFGAFTYDAIISARDTFIAAMLRETKGKVKKKSKEAAEGNAYHAMRNLMIETAIKAARDLNTELPKAFMLDNSVDSDYLTEAKNLDKTRSTPYWSTTHEMFARAFAAYVYDKLEAKGIRSDYLVFGSHEECYANNGYGNPNPTGLERKNINAAFDKLMIEYRLEYVQSLKQESVNEMG